QAVPHVDLQRARLQATAPGGGIHRDRVLCRAADLSPPGSVRPPGSRRRDSPLSEQGLAFEVARVTATCGRGTSGPDRQFVLHRCGAAGEMTHAAHGHASHPTADAEARLNPAANWLWFAPAIGHTSALVIGDISPSYLRGLSPHFERIERIPVASLYRAVVRSDPRAPGSIRFVFGEASMDFVLRADSVSGRSD